MILSDKQSCHPQDESVTDSGAAVCPIAMDDLDRGAGCLQCAAALVSMSGMTQLSARASAR